MILEIEKDYPSLINSNSPSFRVGAEPSEKFKKVKHSTPMLSIQNAKNKEEVIAWSDSLRNFLRIDENLESKPLIVFRVKRWTSPLALRILLLFALFFELGIDSKKCNSGSIIARPPSLWMRIAS